MSNKKVDYILPVENTLVQILQLICYRKKGYATACLNFAKQIAKQNHCYKMMLLTGSKEESALNFYRNAGYNSSDKTAFTQWTDMYNMENDYDI